MYKRNAQGWSKHLDFILVDEAVLIISFFLGTLIKNGQASWGDTVSRNLIFVLALSDIASIIFFNLMHDVLKRDYAREFIETVKLALIVFLIATGFIFFTQNIGAYSRLVLAYTAVFHLILGYAARLSLKSFLFTHGSVTAGKRSMLAVLRNESADKMIERLISSPPEAFHLVGIVLDSPSSRSEIMGVPVVSDLNDVSSYICREWIDSVYIDVPSEDERIQKIMRDCREMAVPVHYHIPGVSRHQQKQFVEKIGGSTVLTLSNNYVTPVQVFFKRMMDIAGGLVGSLLALVVIAIVAPMIRKQSPGPILYRSERIGQNGRRFKMIKIRSMKINADSEKKKLMAQNRVKDGMMFKLDFDPRIIGNEILPDGTKKTGLGEFLRRTSLDEFPQFFNVLAGDMSLVGTRPPTPDEWEKYEFHHRARLATKPGITGMWQVSGRSEIKDFEKVVKLDTDYIQNWSIGLDIKILLKTVWIVIKGKGAM